MRHLAICLPFLLLGACTAPRPPTAMGEHPTMRVADAALASGSPEIAINVARGVLVRDPYNVAAQMMLGHALYTLRLYPQSEAAFRVVLKLQPQDAAAHLAIGRIKLAEQDFGSAEAAFRRSALQQLQPETLSNLGVALDLQHRHAEAQAEYRRALALDPSSKATEANLALSLATSENAAIVADAAPVQAGPTPLAVPAAPRAVDIRPLAPTQANTGATDAPQ